MKYQANIDIQMTAFAKFPQFIRVDLMHNGSKIAEKVQLIPDADWQMVTFDLGDGADEDASHYSFVTYYQDGNAWQRTNVFRNRAALPVDLIGGISFQGDKIGVS